MEITFSIYLNFFIFLYCTCHREHAVAYSYFSFDNIIISCKVAVIRQQWEIDVGSFLSAALQTWSLSKSLWGSGLVFHPSRFSVIG